MPPDADVQWQTAVVERTPAQVRAALSSRLERVYLQIINTPRECVIGGEPGAVLGLEFGQQRLLAWDGPEVVERGLGDRRDARDEGGAAVGLDPDGCPIRPVNVNLGMKAGSLG